MNTAVGWRKAARWIALPWWIVQLGTGAKSFRDNPLIGSQRLNRLGLHVARIRVAHAMAWWRRARLANQVSAPDRDQFARQGYVLVPDLLPEKEFRALRDTLLARTCAVREMTQGDTVTRRIAIDAAMLRDVPALKTLLQSPRWRGLMRYVASYDSEPLYYIQTILTHRADAPADPQTRVHADTFHPTMKAFFFLTDVAEDEGPFSYVPGSHHLTAQRREWERAKSLTPAADLEPLAARGSLRIGDEELRDLGLPLPVRFAVPANTLVVADTCGFHARGPSVRPSVRVEIWAYSRRTPFLPWTGGDILSTPSLAARRVPWLWTARDRLKRWVGQPWQYSGEKRPADP
ncbi:phytanoyl-CoA dioxygenase family protein [Sphingobium subterraneum]|uniref:Phytanoyl-CoA dioxygenase n=1 Tax=Sphingobium subterraneum TaxID=627688 RepID=A0A841IWQ2_9SPHN|nr:phytanoyl-CoA dioxygenase family protein [Sphingobium subterraneum]MBB6122804.1 hypothetical protein [Sphingobium subterraneum]